MNNFAFSLALLSVLFISVRSYTTEDELKAAIDEIQKNPELKAKFDDYLKQKQTRAFGQSYGTKGWGCPGVETHSRTVPTSVHALRPGDVKVVATLGDSLSAANGAGANNVVEVLVQYRGLAFDAGGDGGIEYQTTIPNILRTFNPDLVGQSYGIGIASYWPVAQLNVAVPGSVAEDLPGQAETLVKVMKKHSNVVDFENDWKVVTLFIGGNDLCAQCNKKDKYSVENWYKHIHTAIKTIHDNIPRVMINLVGVLHVELLRGVEDGHWFCSVMHKTLCPCVYDREETKEDFEKIVGAYQQKEMELATSQEFERDDFTVVLQPFMMETEHLPRLEENNEVDLSFFAPDCFHFSRKGHDTAARGLWNNMMEPVGSKERAFNISEFYVDPLKCPDPNCPFIRTNQNSESCEKYLTLSAQENLAVVPKVKKEESSEETSEEGESSSSEEEKTPVQLAKEADGSGSSGSAAPGSASPALVAVVVVVLAGIVVGTLGTVMYHLQKRKVMQQRNTTPSTCELAMN